MNRGSGCGHPLPRFLVRLASRPTAQQHRASHHRQRSPTGGQSLASGGSGVYHRRQGGEAVKPENARQKKRNLHPRRPAEMSRRTYGITPPGYRLPAELKLGTVRLQVADLDRSLEWYGRVLGVELLEQRDGVARLGARG